MKHPALFGGLVVAAVLAGVALAQSEPRLSPSVRSKTPTPAFTISSGYKCPVGQGVGRTIVDEWEHRPTATARRAIAVEIANLASLSFDPETRVDLDRSPGEAEFAFRDSNGYLLARIRAERVLGGWVVSGWTSCGGLRFAGGLSS